MERKLSSTLFYTIDKCIRSYRQYGQRQLKKAGLKITIDQWLVIKTISETPDIKQQELGIRVFKDGASVTRIIDLLVRSNYIQRKNNAEDRRRATLIITAAGQKVISDVEKIVLKNRAHALKNIGEEELSLTRDVLLKIITNCQK